LKPNVAYVDSNFCAGVVELMKTSASGDSVADTSRLELTPLG
jgi:hypothetical protein